ncbi:MAG: aldo/keto reductase [Acidobacteriota bacterium]|jgi:predicted aldo/keto reductase-like oxidoreductase|nr:aldo/keto reductase [Acidobacteriota bacterium]
MKRMVLGKTGIEAARLAFGGIPIQRLSEREAIEIVVYSLEKGMDFIDTSRMYTTSETRIGKALKETSRKAAVATKSFGRSADAIRKDVDISLKELQLDYIDIYQCHGISSPEEYKRVTAPGGALEGLIQAKEQGLIGHIGITSHSLDLLEKIVDDGLFETIMVCFSFLEPAAKDKVIPKARAKGIGILAMKPFSGGVIEAPEAALKWVLSYPDILVLAGVEYKNLIDQNWRVFEGSWELNAEEDRRIREICAEYDKKFCRRCDYCLPCPAEVPIQFVLGARSILKRMGSGAMKTPMFANMLEKAAQCTVCGDCMSRCPYNLPIPDMIKDNLAWMKEAVQ